ncbi:MAG: hypothetical protein OWQ56_11390, partial [Acidithiobacillus caldus]|nr:hypothetical protein [Acidithiobacillus caldus]
ALMAQGFTSGDLSAYATTANQIFDFSNGTGGVTIATGASLTLGGHVFVVGNGNVNVDAPFNISANSSNYLEFDVASGSNININASIQDSGGNIDVGDGGGVANLNVSATGSLTANTIDIGLNINPAGGSTVFDHASQSVMNILDNGAIVATGTGTDDLQLGALNMVPNGSGGYTNINQAGMVNLPSGTIVQAIGSVSGSGYLQGNSVLFLNQVGPVNNDTTGQILANGFQIKPGSQGYVDISLVPGWSSASGFNVQVPGTAAFGLAYQAPSYSGSSTVSLNPQADDASRLIVQATGTLEVGNADSGLVSAVTLPGSSGTTPAIVFPGLVYLRGDQGLTVDNPIDTAYSTSTPQGYGVFLLGPTVNDPYPIIANGDRGINIEGVNYGPTIFNGTNVTQGAPSLPPMYFLQSSNGALNLEQTATFSNEWDWTQPQQVFFVSPQFTGNSYPKNG